MLLMKKLIGLVMLLTTLQTEARADIVQRGDSEAEIGIVALLEGIGVENFAKYVKTSLPRFSVGKFFFRNYLTATAETPISNTSRGCNLATFVSRRDCKISIFRQGPRANSCPPQYDEVMSRGQAEIFDPQHASRPFADCKSQIFKYFIMVKKYIRSELPLSGVFGQLYALLSRSPLQESRRSGTENGDQREDFDSKFPLLAALLFLLVGFIAIYYGLWNLKFGPQNWIGDSLTIRRSLFFLHGVILTLLWSEGRISWFHFSLPLLVSSLVVRAWLV